jgi:hypothetical protein
MKIIKISIIVFVAFLSIGKSNGQTAGEVIDKYLSAIGGKEKVSQIKSFYTEGKMEVMGMEGKIKTTILNGKGMRQETDMMGQTQVTCLNEKGGWVTNPFQGNSAPTDMPAEVYDMMRNQITIAAPFVNFQANNMTVESAGNEAIGAVNTIKVKMIKADNTFTTCYFDQTNFRLIRTVQKANVRGQEVEMTLNYSNYKDAGNGYTIPFTTETDMGNGMKVVGTILTAEVDKAVDPSIFNKP